MTSNRISMTPEPVDNLIEVSRISSLFSPVFVTFTLRGRKYQVRAYDVAYVVDVAIIIK